MSRRGSYNDEKVNRLKEALRPLAEKGVTRDEAHTIVWTAVASMRQGSSIDHYLPAILNEMFERSPNDLSNDTRACQDYVYRALVEAMSKRDLANTEWITDERFAVAAAASRWAKENLYPRGVTVEDVKRIEVTAVGHIDYASKLALRIAEFIVYPDKVLTPYA